MNHGSDAHSTHANPTHGTDMHANSSETGHYHSHRGMYIRLGVILTIITAVELALPFLKDYPDIWNPIKPVWKPLLVLLSVAKFGAVVGEFMHLRGDRKVYQFLFISPLVLAVLLFPLVTTLSMVNFRPFGEGYAATAIDVRSGYVAPTKGPNFEAPLADDKFLAAFTEAKTKNFAEGHKLFDEKCAACHGKAGEGVANLGFNLTDNCYKYGGSFKDLYMTVGKGQNGGKMPAWSASMKGEEIRQVVYYVKSLKGSNAPGGQPCVGDPVND
jgi:mono/diheme cytochrome c family protein/cytochrome c oxidase subunit IV